MKRTGFSVMVDCGLSSGRGTLMKKKLALRFSFTLWVTIRYITLLVYYT